MVQAERIELPDGTRMRVVNLDGYKYVGVLQLDSIMNREMKKSKYIRRIKKFLRSQFNGENVITGINAGEVGIIRYEAASVLLDMGVRI